MSGGIVQRLVDLLPALEMRVALAMPLLCEKDLFRLIESLPELKAEQALKLKKVIVEGTTFYKQMQNVFKAGAVQPLLRQTGGSSTSSGTL